MTTMEPPRLSVTRFTTADGIVVLALRGEVDLTTGAEIQRALLGPDGEATRYAVVPVSGGPGPPAAVASRNIWRPRRGRSDALAGRLPAAPPTVRAGRGSVLAPSPPLSQGVVSPPCASGAAPCSLRLSVAHRGGVPRVGGARPTVARWPVRGGSPRACRPGGGAGRERGLTRRRGGHGGDASPLSGRVHSGGGASLASPEPPGPQGGEEDAVRHRTGARLARHTRQAAR
jgi:hypothetical protein